MPALPLNDRQREIPSCAISVGVGVPELVQREPSPHASLGSEPPELAAGRWPSAATRRAGKDKIHGPIGSWIRGSGLASDRIDSIVETAAGAL